ncbi:reverse transcriptase domain-containing protein [Tanacetum coccineum]
MLKRCEDTKLALNWEKSHFMVKEGIVLGHKISRKGIEVDKAKVDVISKLPHPTTVKGIRSFLGHAGFYRRFIKDFSKISRPMTHLLEKNTPFIFSEDCILAFQTLKKKLTEAPILIALNWDQPFEIMCDANDYAIRCGQPKKCLRLFIAFGEDLHEENFQVYSNPLFDFDDNFKSSNVNPLFEENDKDVKIKSSFSLTLTSLEESEFEAYLEKESIPPGINLTLEVSSSNPTSPTLTGEKEKEDKVSSDVPINTIVMPIRITFDNPIDFNDHFSKPEDFKKDLTVTFDSTNSSILSPPLLDSDSPFTAELSASITLNSLRNEDKVFKPGILVYHAIHDKNLVTLEENLKENISSGTLLVFKELSFLLPLPKPPDECLNFELNLVMKNVVLNEDFYQSNKTLPLNVEDMNSFTFIIWTFLPHFTYTEESPLIFSFRNISKIIRKQSKNGQARTRESEEAKESKPKPEKSNPQSSPVNMVNKKSTNKRQNPKNIPFSPPSFTGRQTQVTVHLRPQLSPMVKSRGKLKLKGAEVYSKAPKQDGRVISGQIIAHLSSTQANANLLSSSVTNDLYAITSDQSLKELKGYDLKECRVRQGARRIQGWL